MADKRYKYIHPECGKIAFYLAATPAGWDISHDSTEPIFSWPVRKSNLTLLNDEEQKDSDPIICGNCGMKIPYLRMKNIKPIKKWNDI